MTTEISVMYGSEKVKYVLCTRDGQDTGGLYLSAQIVSEQQDVFLSELHLPQASIGLYRLFTKCRFYDIQTLYCTKSKHQILCVFKHHIEYLDGNVLNEKMLGTVSFRYKGCVVLHVATWSTWSYVEEI